MTTSMHRPCTARNVFAVLSSSLNLLLFVSLYFRPFMKVCEVGLFNTCLALLKALIEVSLKRKVDVAFITRLQHTTTLNILMFRTSFSWPTACVIPL